MGCGARLVDEHSDIDAQVTLRLMRVARRVHQRTPLLEVLVVLPPVDLREVKVELADRRVPLGPVGVLDHQREHRHLGL